MSSNSQPFGPGTDRDRTLLDSIRRLPEPDRAAIERIVNTVADAAVLKGSARGTGAAPSEKPAVGNPASSPSDRTTVELIRELRALRYPNAEAYGREPAGLGSWEVDAIRRLYE
jgi:hypothetical protein